MKHFALAVLSLIFLTVPVGPVRAQFERSDVYDTPLGSIYVSPFPDSYYPIMNGFPAFTVQKIYVVADIDFGDIGQASQNLSNGIQAWDGSVTLPPAVNILGSTLTPSRALTLGSGPGDYIVATGTTITAGSTPSPLVTLYMFATTYAWLAFNMELGPASIPALDNNSAWVEALALNGCQNIVTNLASPCFFVWEFQGNMLISNDIAVEDESFGGLKARFDR